MSNPREMSSRLVGTGGACSTISRPFVLAGPAYFNEFVGTDGADAICVRARAWALDWCHEHEA
jgi:hypothetical protein